MPHRTTNSLDVGLVQSDETGVNPQGDRRQMKVIKQDGQVIVKATARMKVQLQDTRRDEC